MKYYMGKGSKLKKENCKEYKTLKNATIAARERNLSVWDEMGNRLFEPDGQNDSEDATNVAEKDNGEDQQATEQEAESIEANVIFPKNKTKATVICDGSLNLRRSPSWEDKDVCGRAVKGQSYYVKSIHTVEGKKMVQTIDSIFLSGEPEHVQFEVL